MDILLTVRYADVKAPEGFCFVVFTGYSLRLMQEELQTFAKEDVYLVGITRLTWVKVSPKATQLQFYTYNYELRTY